MNVVTIYGSSDDLVEVEVDGPVSFLPLGHDGETMAELTQMKLVGKDGALRVRVRYGDSSCWGIEVAPLDEDTPMLPVEIGQQPRIDGRGHGYSARAIVHGVELIEYELIDDEAVQAEAR
jgi:hypothetical protein